MRPYRSSVRRRRGFSLTEMVVAAVLATLLMSLLAMSWVAFGRPALEVEARARIAQEGILATQSIACDLGGFLADTPGQTGTLVPVSIRRLELLQQRCVPPELPGGELGDVIVITYQLSGEPARSIQLIHRRDDDHRQVRDGLLRRPEPEQCQPGLDPDHDRLPLLHGNLYLDRCTSIMIGPAPVRPRRGYSLTVVLIFLILLFALWSTVSAQPPACSESRRTGSCNRPAIRVR